VVLNHFAEGGQIQTYAFVRELHKNILPQINWHVLFYCINEVCYTKYWRCYWKTLSTARNPFQQKSDTKLLPCIHFAYEVSIISSYSNRICYWKIAKCRTKDAWELHSALRRVIENHCSSNTSNTTEPASYDATALAIIKRKKHQMLADPLLQSGVVTRNNRV